jgi:uncharacterized protein YyaL (SSP411 family)
VPDDPNLPPLPGAEPFSPELAERIAGALRARPPDAVPRTRHRDGTVPRFTNRLIFESSPYLQQHAHNPVNWYSWGDEAFAAARAANKPLFLSIGYSTCHWCHVMEEQSFEDLEIAQLLNERFIAIKVDREERPDVDTVYMTAVQALTGHGGWPMSVWLDADRRPFYTGTYFPRPAFAQVLERLSEIYAEDPGRVAEAATSITAAVQGAMAGADASSDVPGTEALDAAVRFYAQVYDVVCGGVRGAPKFPSSLPVRLLLRQHRRTGDTEALAMAEHTLAMMAAGGMHDQLAGGFHRYSTDERWLVPHFEKMLYDNALLAVAYAEAWQVTGRADFARVLLTTLDYVLREMTSPDGAFYSATDADSEGEEGTFFLWTIDEIRQLLGPSAERFIAFYGVTAAGNFEGKNILYVPAPNEETWTALEHDRELLRHAREQRPHPLRDEKILTAWNGLMISALAIGGRLLDAPRYIDAAARAADFVLDRMSVNGRLQRSWKDGRGSGAGFLEDDAFFIAGLLDLYEATFDRRWLARAIDLAERSETLFADTERGGWFRSAADHEQLLAREKPHYDGAEPAGSSVALLNVLRLATITADDRWREIAERALRASGAVLREQAPALHEMLLALDYFVDPGAKEVVLVWQRGAPPPPAFTGVLRATFLPHCAVLGAAEGPELAALAELTPLAAERTTIDGKPAAYVCERGTCQLPTNDPDLMLAQLTGAHQGDRDR